MKEAVALVVLGACLAAAVTGRGLIPDWGLAVGGALVVVLAGVTSAGTARAALSSLGPTVAFLAALLVLADGCRRAGLFEALGAAMARGARSEPRRLMSMVFLAAAATTAVLSLDATVVLLTPVVFATARRVPARPRPHVYACAHLANTASLLLPVSNLTNLLAFQASGLSFARFGALMTLPWLVGMAVEWLVLSRMFAKDLERPLASTGGAAEPPRWPVGAICVVGATLVGFGLSSLIGVAPVWFAVLGALALSVHQRPAPRELVAAAQPTFLLFVLGLGVVVRAAGVNGLSATVDSLIPHGIDLAGLLAIAAVGAVLANVVNNLPATLILLPVIAKLGAGAVLAMLVGVNIGPNLTYVGSLATLLWRRVLESHDAVVDLGEFTRLGALTVPSALTGSTLALWLGLRVL